VARGGWGGRVELRGSTGLWRNELEEGFLGWAHRQSAGACCGLQCRPVRDLCGSGRCAALFAGAVTERGFNATVRRPPRPACTRDRLWTGGHLRAVRRGTRCGSRSKDGMREGDHDPDLEAVGSEPARTPRRRSSLSTTRGAARTGRAPGASAVLWSAAELFFSRSTRL
jgi:hypothetical protein